MFNSLCFALLMIGCVPENTASQIAESSPTAIKTELPEPCAIDTTFLRAKAQEAKDYCRAQKADTQQFLLVDLSRHSGCRRFFVWQGDSLRHAFMVSHGCAQNPWGADNSKEKAVVSNQENSHASSVGKYLIGKRGNSSWGIGVNYTLHGKEATNSNAVKRLIVLHSWEAVSDSEVHPKGTPEGWGCPALSNNHMKVVDQVLQEAKKPVLLWVFQEGR